MKNKVVISLIVCLIVVGSVISFFIFNNNKQYEIKFDTLGGTTIQNVIVKNGDVVSKPEDPVKEGYLFKEWLYNNESYEFNNKVSSDITLIAQWVKIEDGKTMYVVKFDTLGGTTIANEIVEKGNKVNKPENPVRQGYIFETWTLNGTTYDFNSEVNSNIELKAVWKKDDDSSSSDSNKNESNMNIETPTLTLASGENSKGKKIVNLNIVTEGYYATPTNVFSGYEIYEKVENQYKLVTSINGNKSYEVEVDIGENKAYVARAYIYNDKKEKVYSSYSNTITINNSKVENPTLSDASGVISEGKKIVELNIVMKGYYATLTNYLSGYEIYEKVGSQYKLVTSIAGNKSYKVEVDIGENKTYAARAYIYNDKKEKIYSSYSNTITINNSKVETPTLSDAFGVISEGKKIVELNIVMKGYYATLTNYLSGYEIYEKEGSQYKLVTSIDGNKSYKVEVDIGENKTYVARAYIYNDKKQKIYSSYSNAIIIDNSKVATPTLSKVSGGSSEGKKTAKLNIVAEGYYGDLTNYLSGYEIYEKEGSQYKLVTSIDGNKAYEVEIDIDENKTYVARAYIYNDNQEKVYSSYSNEIDI